MASANPTSLARRTSSQRTSQSSCSQYDQPGPPLSPSFTASAIQPRTRSHSHSRSLSRSRSNHTRQSRARTQSDASGFDPEQSTPPRQPSPPPRQENAPPPAEEVTKLRLAAHYSGLVLAAMLGCLARLGLDGLAEYDGRVVFPLAWSQGVGSGVMGLALARKNEIISIYPPIYTFLTTGIAGSITTFSSWMLEGYLSFSNYDGYDRKGLHDTVDGVAYSLSTFAIALASLRMGEHVASILPALPIPKPSRRSESSSSPTASGEAGVTSASASSSTTRHGDDTDLANGLDVEAEAQVGTNARAQADGTDNGTSGLLQNGQEKGGLGIISKEKRRSHPPSHPRRPHPTLIPIPNPNPKHLRLSKSHTPLLDLLAIATALASYLIALLLYFLAPHYNHTSWRHKVLFPLLLSPPGAILRFFLSRYNTYPVFMNKFPLGTFLANMIATLIISGVYVAQRQSSVGAVRCNALYAIQQGFCGCLSTVSTFVIESRTVSDPRWKWTYIATSVVLGHLFVLSIVGGVGWSRGHAMRLDPVCAG
ncbi:hypothetical protein I317_00228 [Kwoniella heveanensis CBS 569]|nr:hypothetical protein I317_00228 [Kwoniella heveanensis CBS 569]